MNQEQRQAYRWAKNQNYTSVAAKYAKILAGLVDEMTPQNEPERAGLYGKYTVRKNSDGSLVTDCFVLRPGKDPAAATVLRAYAAATDNTELAADIINWVGAEQNESLSVLVDDEPTREYIDYICPRCKETISQRRRGQSMSTVYQCRYHDNCGQRVDWTNPQIYRRPHERQEKVDCDD